MLVLFLTYQALGATRQKLCLGLPTTYYYYGCLFKFTSDYETNVKEKMSATDPIHIYFSDENVLAAFNLSIFKGKDVLFESQDVNYYNAGNLTLILDLPPEELNTTRLSFDSIALTLKTISEEKSLDLQSFDLKKTTLNDIDGWSLSTDDIKIRISYLNNLSSIIIRNNFDLIIDNHTNLTLSDTIFEIDAMKFPLTNAKTQTITLSQLGYYDDKFNIELTSTSANSPKLLITAGGNYIFNNYLSEYSIIAKEAKVSVHLNDTSLLSNEIIASQFTIWLKNQTNIIKSDINAEWLKFDTYNDFVTMVEVGNYSGKIEISNSMINLEIDYFTMQMGYYDKSHGIVNSIGKNRISSCTIRKEFTPTPYGSMPIEFTQARFRTEFNIYKSVEELKNLLFHNFTIIRIKNFSSPIIPMKVIYIDDSPVVGGFSAKSNSISAFTDDEDGYKVVAYVDDPLKQIFEIELIKGDNVDDVVEKIPNGFKNVVISFRSYISFDGTLDFSNISETNMPLNLSVQSLSTGYAEIGLIIPEGIVSNLTIIGIQLKDSTINADILNWQAVSIATGSKIDFGNTSVYIRYRDFYKILDYKFNDLIVTFDVELYYIEQFIFTEDTWRFQGASTFGSKPVPYNVTNNLTLIGHVKPTLEMDIQAKHLKGLTLIPYKGFELTVKGNLGEAQIDGKVTIKHGLYEMLFVANTPKIDQIVFEGEGKVTIQYSYTPGKDICSCATRDECNDTCTDEMNFVDFVNLDSTLAAASGTSISVHIGETDSSHPIISTKNLKSSIIKFIGIDNLTSLIEFNSDNIDITDGTITSFERLTLKSNSTTKFGAISIIDCEIKLGPLEVGQITCSYSDLLKFVSLKCSELNLDGEIPVFENEKEFDIESASCSLKITTNSTIISLSNNSLDINKLKFITTGEIILDYDSALTTTIESTEGAVVFPKITILKLTDSTVNIKGSFDHVSSGMIKILRDTKCTFNFYAKAIPFEFDLSENSVFCAFTENVDILYSIKLTISKSSPFMSCTYDDSLLNATISFKDAFYIVYTTFAGNTIQLLKPNLTVNIELITKAPESNYAKPLRIQYYLNLDGVGRVNINNMIGYEAKLDTNVYFTADTSGEISQEKYENFFKVNRTLLTAKPELLKRSLTINMTPLGGKQQAHGFSKNGHSFGIDFTSHEFILYTVIDPKEIPITMFYGSATSCTADYEICLKEEDLKNISSFHTPGIDKINMFISITCAINLNDEKLANAEISIDRQPGSYITPTVTMELGSLKSLTFNYLTYNISNGEESKYHIEKFITLKTATPSAAGKNFDFNNIDSIEASTTGLSKLGLTSFTKPLKVIYTSGAISFNADSWTYYSTYKLNPTDFPQASFEFQTTSPTFNVASNIDSVVPPNIILAKDSSTVSIGDDWDAINQQIIVKNAPGTSIYRIETKSFHYPFVFNSSIIPVLSFSYSNVTTTKPITLENWSIKVEFKMPSYYSTSLYAFIGTELNLKGNNVITASYPTNGAIQFTDVTAKTNSISSFDNLYVTNSFVSEAGSEFHGMLNAKKMELHWLDDSFPFIEITAASKQIPDEINIIYDGDNYDKYEELVYNRTFSLIDSKNGKCEDFKGKVNFVSPLKNYNGVKSVFDVICEENLLRIKAARVLDLSTPEATQSVVPRTPSPEATQSPLATPSQSVPNPTQSDVPPQTPVPTQSGVPTQTPIPTQSDVPPQTPNPTQSEEQKVTTEAKKPKPIQSNDVNNNEEANSGGKGGSQTGIIVGVVVAVVVVIIIIIVIVVVVKKKRNASSQENTTSSSDMKDSRFESI